MKDIKIQPYLDVIEKNVIDKAVLSVINESGDCFSLTILKDSGFCLYGNKPKDIASFCRFLKKSLYEGIAIVSLKSEFGIDSPFTKGSLKELRGFILSKEAIVQISKEKLLESFVFYSEEEMGDIFFVGPQKSQSVWRNKSKKDFI